MFRFARSAFARSRQQLARGLQQQQQPLRFASRGNTARRLGALVAGGAASAWVAGNAVFAASCCPVNHGGMAGGAGSASGAGASAAAAGCKKTCEADHTCCKNDLDYTLVRKAIADLIDSKDDWKEDGIGPFLVRLAWHTSGTYDAETDTGGSDGCTIRFAPEIAYGANAGLAIAQTFLEPIKRQFPSISYADLYTLAGVVALEEMGGPEIKWRPGRCDAKDGSACTPDGRLPDGAWHDPQQVRDHFARKGFNDREVVALIGGGHSLGRCHADRSGFIGPWTDAPTTFSNMFFTELLNNTWTLNTKHTGNVQYDSPDGKMMLPADMALKLDPAYRPIVEEFARDDKAFRAEFAAAFQKLEELGCKRLQGVDPATKFSYLAAAPLVAGVCAAAIGICAANQ